MNTIVISFLVFLAIALGVGLYSARRKRRTSEDYLLASRSVGPVLTGLSAASTTLSGMTFMGFVGLTYKVGIHTYLLWAAIALGIHLAWRLSFERLRAGSSRAGAQTFPEFLSSGVRGSARGLRASIALILLVFLSCYAAAQLNAGSKALHVLLKWDHAVGILLGGAIVLGYCAAGGLRASIWTDALQATVMFLALVVLCGVALAELGGLSGLGDRLAAIDPQLMRFFPDHLNGFGVPLLVTMFLVGFGILGQPHILVRAMAAASPEAVTQSRRIYFWYHLSYGFISITAGLCCRALLDTSSGFDAELGLPTLAVTYLPPVLVGLFLAGLFSAAISTADSQVLVCSSAVSRDLTAQQDVAYGRLRLATTVVTLLVVVVAFVGDKSVYTMVMLSWNGMAASLAPLFVLVILRKPVEAKVAMGMVLSGLVVAVTWRLLGFHTWVSEALVGGGVGVATYLTFSQRTPTERPL